MIEELKFDYIDKDNKEETIIVCCNNETNKKHLKKQYYIEGLDNFMKCHQDLTVQEFNEKMNLLLQSIKNGCIALDGRYRSNFLNTKSNFNCIKSTTNIGVFVCESPIIQISCNRCDNLSVADKNVKICGNCSSPISIVFIPTFSDDNFGFLSVKGGKLQSFLKSQYQFNCFECDTRYQSKPVGINEKFSVNCFNCHELLKFQILKISPVEKQDFVFKHGQALPDNGRCKHYKKSFRWFRFPCCGLAFPCDICHDDKMNHPSELASKMICGLCSKEQSTKVECACGMSLKKEHKQFWEGGKGSRDKSTMSKKDRKKFKN